MPKVGRWSNQIKWIHLLTDMIPLYEYVMNVMYIYIYIYESYINCIVTTMVSSGSMGEDVD